MKEGLHKPLGRRSSNIDLGKSEHISGLATFSPEQRRGLEHSGYILHQLTGQSIATLRDAGNSFWSSLHKGEAFENEHSMCTEVAVNPRTFFLPHSNRKTLSEQLALISQFNAEIGREIPGVIAKLGGVSDYAELAFAHERATGDRLFGRDYDYDHTRTTTPTGGFSVAVVGSYGDLGLGIFYWHRDISDGYVWAAPLVVPEPAQ